MTKNDFLDNISEILGEMVLEDTVGSVLTHMDSRGRLDQKTLYRLMGLVIKYLLEQEEVKDPDAEIKAELKAELEQPVITEKLTKNLTKEVTKDEEPKKDKKTSSVQSDK